MDIFECLDTILNRTENPELSKIPSFKLLGVVLLRQKIPCPVFLIFFIFLVHSTSFNVVFELTSFMCTRLQHTGPA